MIVRPVRLTLEANTETGWNAVSIAPDVES